MTTFPDVLEAADQRSLDEQERLIEILRRRIAERQRAGLVPEVAQARRNSPADNAARPV